jgi:hypothetical protein
MFLFFASSGATLRRHGEQALKEDIQNLMKEWKLYLNSCGVILTSIPKTMLNYVFDESSNDYPLHKNDKRIRKITFMTEKPTFEEVKKVHKRCSTLKIQKIDTCSCELLGNESNLESSLESITMAELIETKSNEVESFHRAIYVCNPMTKDLIDASINGDMNKLKSVLETLDNNNFSSDEAISSLIDMRDFNKAYVVNAVDSMDQLFTPLHYASEAGHADIVYALLVDGEADPTRLDVRSRPPYFLAKNKEVRDCFRRCRGITGMESKWNWNSSGVPTGILLSPYFCP